MIKQKKTFDEIFDLVGVRIITKEDKRDCYVALGIVHSLWKPIPGRFKDYIAVPKSNMYQSLHTTVIGPGGKPIEIQIKTRKMHEVAENGVASHWNYKEGNLKTDPRFEKKMAWLRKTIEQQSYLLDSKDFMDSLKIDLFAEEVFVFTPKGEIKELPRGSTPIDFAYLIHTDVGNHCTGAKVNGRVVPLSYKLANGDLVEIITSPKTTPIYEWLKLVRTAKARSNIKQWLKKKGQLEPSPQLELPLEPQDVQQIPSEKSEKPTPKKREITCGVKIEGLQGVTVRFAGCCNPVPGDKIIGYVTRGRGVSIHRVNCPNISPTENGHKVLEISWDTVSKTEFEVGISALGYDRKGLLADMLIALTNADTTITAAESKASGNGLARCNFTVLIKDKESIRQTINILEKIPGVIEVFRTQPQG
jgi:GTP pyrophosphokinase